MPFVNGRFYMNPAYGRALEAARTKDSAKRRGSHPFARRSDLIDRYGESTPANTLLSSEQDRNLDHQDAGQNNGHWVTIDGHHVLIDEADGTQHSRRDRGRQRQQAIRESIAKIAGKYAGNTGWAFAKQKDDFARNTNKCNKYVYDVTKEAGAEPSIVGSDGKARPPLAGEWADPNTKIANWELLGQNEEPQPGDVAAYKLPGHASYTGHSGIVTSVDSDGSVHAMAAHDNVVGPDDKFNPGVGAAIIAYRRFTGGQK
jgi:hypothetical protein